MLRLGAVVLLSVSLSAVAAAMPLDLNQPVASVNAQIAKIQSDLSGGEVYSEINSEQRRQVRESLTRITNRLERATDGRLPAPQEVGAFNDQELVNTILTQAREDSRLVCRREKTLGSNRITPNCMTVAERRRARERGEQDISKMQRRGLDAN